MRRVTHKSLIFFLFDEAEVRWVPQRDYVKLLGGALRMPEHANRTMRVADWYIRLQDDHAASVVNETYSVLQLDASGAIDWSRCRVGQGRNHALYEALRTSRYDDPDDDPAVQKLRAQTCDEVAWLPNSDERRRLERFLAHGDYTANS